MEVVINSPYLITLTDVLRTAMGLRHGDNVVFCITRSKEGELTAIWIGKESIFSPPLSFSYTLKRSYYRGMYGFAAKAFVYETGLPPGAYAVSESPFYCKKTGIDWWEVRIKARPKRNWRAIKSSGRKKSSINLENLGEDIIFDT